MKIYSVIPDFDHFDTCSLDRGPSIFRFNGRSVENDWTPLRVKRYNEGPLGSFISHLGRDAIILEKSAIDKLYPLMRNVEILPLNCNFGDYWVVNVLDVLRCVNYDQSNYRTLAGKCADGRPRIYWFDKIAFFPECIEGYHIFKTVDCPAGAIYVDDEFVGEVKKHGITGFSFQAVWEG